MSSSSSSSAIAANAQVPAVKRRRYGDAVVTALGDGYLELPTAALLNIDDAGATALLDAAFRSSTRGSLNAFLVEQDDRRVLIDTGAGSAMGPSCGALPRLLQAAGVEPGSIGTVVLTHLHPDHIGGLAPGGAAAFPNAELVVHEAEAAFWLDPASEGRAPEPMRPYFAGARAATAPYQGRMRLIREGGEAAVPGIEAVPLPGHTPGHTGYRVGGGKLLIWGDIVHMPDVQAARPDVGIAFDADPQAARATRERVLDMAATERLAVAGMHMHFPAFSHVVRDGSGYRFVPELWAYEI